MNSTDKEKYRLKNERAFALYALKHYTLYLDLMEHERDAGLKNLFRELALIAKSEFTFWGTKSAVRGDEAHSGMFAKLFHRMLRRALGVTLTTHLLINRERTKLRNFDTYCIDCLDTGERKAIEAMIGRSLALVPVSEDPHFKFFSSVVLRFNDALMELVGALIGFSFALRDPKMVIAVGLVSGITAAASIAASAYLEAEHEKNKDPHRAAFYRGMSYLATATVLVFPFLISGSLLIGNIVMLLMALTMVLILTLYSAVVVGKSYLSQLRKILALSCGVAFVAFSIGHLLNLFFVGS